MTAKHSLPVLITKWYPASPEAVFDAWIKPELIRQWLFLGSGSEVINIEQDLQPGGSFLIMELDPKTGGLIDHFGSYLKIERPARLMFTLEVPVLFKGVTTVIVTLKEEDKGCELSFVQTGIERSVTEDSWERMLKRLNTVVSGK